MASDHTPKYWKDGFVKCSCGWKKECGTKAKAMASWAEHFRAKSK